MTKISHRSVYFGAGLLTASLMSGAASSRAEESIDSLLNRADHALGPAPASPSDSQEQAAPKKKAAGKAKKSAARTSTLPKDEAASPAEGPAAPTATAERPLTPIDPARVSEILAIDQQARERERLARGANLIARIGLSRDAVPGVYQTEKDDDTFTVADTMVLAGPTLDVATHARFGASDAGIGANGAFYWGLNAGAGYLQGSADVSRRGIQNESNSYVYEALPFDAAASLGWQTATAWQIWVSAGYGMDIVRQVGNGETDSFTSVFAGETLAVGLSKRFGPTYEAFLQYRQRGLQNAIDKAPTRSRLAGRVITAGLGVPISG